MRDPLTGFRSHVRGPGGETRDEVVQVLSELVVIVMLEALKSLWCRNRSGLGRVPPTVDMKDGAQWISSIGLDQQ
jgi:hypothetical protein